MFRFIFRRILKFSVSNIFSKNINKLLQKLPYSRYNKYIYFLLKGIEIQNYYGANIRVNPGDVQGYYLYLFNDYENLMMEKLLEICSEEKTFFDIGANYGWISLALANSNNSLNVYSFEPDKKNFEEFNLNLDINKDLRARIKPINKAVYDSNTLVNFVPSPFIMNPGVSRIDEDVITSDYRVETVSLDSFCSNRSIYPDVIKIDVEGAELKVLKGMFHLLSQKKVRTIVVEVHGFYYENEIEKFNSEVINELINHDYKIFFLDNENLVPYKDEFNKSSKMHIFAYS